MVKVFNVKGEEEGDIELPNHFSESFRPNLIKRAFLASKSKNRQTQGTDERAGMKGSWMIYKQRRRYKGVFGRGRSRTPGKVVTRVGSQFQYEGDFAPQTKGGRKAHPPKTEKKYEEDINKKERRKAIRCAISATAMPEYIEKRGHKFLDDISDFPLVLEGIEDIEKTKEVEEFLSQIGLTPELEDARRKGKVGPLIVVSGEVPLLKAARNIPGLNVVKVDNLNVPILAPGSRAARLTLFTKPAIEKMKEEKLFGA